MKNKLRKALLEKRVCWGGWIQIGHPASAEILAALGFDWVCVDLEHGAIDLETAAAIFRTIEAFDCVPVARIPTNDLVWIRRSLDAGARGLIVPDIRTAEQARNVIQQAKYPPMGQRGFGYSRANRHGMTFREYIATANEEIAVVLQTEHYEALENLDAILEVPGIDALFIGPLDLSGSMGVPGQLDHPRMQAGLERFLQVCHRRGMAAGMHVVHCTPEIVSRILKQGYTLLALGMDNVFLMEAARQALSSARDQEGAG